MRPLSPHGQAPTVAQTAIAPDLDQAPDVHLHFFAQITFDSAFFFQNLAEIRDLLVVQVAHLLAEIDSRAIEQRPRPRTPYAVQMRQGNLRPLIIRQINAF
jgi:hypothetical protein